MTLFNQLLGMAEAVNDEIPRTLVRQAIGARDLELSGLVFSMIHNHKIRNRIKPPLEMVDFQELHLSYLPDCIKSPTVSDWCESPYLAGHAIVAWIRHLWQQQLKTSDYLVVWKHTLAKLYIQGDEAVRDIVINGIMEHLFQVEDIRFFFNDWRGHAILERAYNMSLPSASGISEADDQWS